MAANPLPFEAFLEVRSANGGAFSPDGRTLAFLMNDSGVPQVYCAESPSRPPRRLTDTGEIVRGVFWSPDGTRLLYSMDEGGSERTGLHLLAADGSGGKQLTRHAGAIHQFGGWAPDGRRIVFTANRRNEACFDCYVLDVDSGEERCVLQTEGHFVPLEWAPDGEQVLLREQVTGSDENLHLLNTATGELRLVTPHQGDARYPSAHFMPDSRTLVLCSDQDREFLALLRLDTRFHRMRPLLERRADAESCELSRDGRRVCALFNREGWSEVIIARIGERQLSRVVDARLGGVASSCRMAENGSRIAVSMNGPTQNPNVWEMDPDSTARVQWTHASMGSVDPATLTSPQSLRYPTHDGREIPAWLYRAPGAKAAVVHVHGGPESQDRPNFSPVYQYLVQSGYSVLAPNVRGSSGYGKTYSHLDDREKRYDALKDVEYAHRWLTAQGIAAADRIAVMGASYGGFTVLYCLTRQPELWAAGVDIVGIANFETFFRHTGPWRRKLRASEYGDPERDAALLKDLSPIHHLAGIRAPLMVVQGANDPRVPQVESDQMVEQLRSRNHPVEYLLFPDEGHGIVKIPNRLRAYPAIAEFLRKHVPTDA